MTNVPLQSQQNSGREVIKDRLQIAFLPLAAIYHAEMHRDATVHRPARASTIRHT